MFGIKISASSVLPTCIWKVTLFPQWCNRKRTFLSPKEQERPSCMKFLSSLPAEGSLIPSLSFHHPQWELNRTDTTTLSFLFLLLHARTPAESVGKLFECEKARVSLAKSHWRLKAKQDKLETSDRILSAIPWVLQVALSTCFIKGSVPYPLRTKTKHPKPHNSKTKSQRKKRKSIFK